MAFVPGLRSGYSLTGGLVHFGRMLDKIRLQAAGRLPADYQSNLGAGFDGRTCAFLGVTYDAVKTRVLVGGGSDEDILAWAHSQGGERTGDQRAIWNRFMMKLGWRDDRSAVLRERVVALGLIDRPIATFFDLNDFDEGRDPVGTRAWELKEPRIFIIMGVCGSGKTTVGKALARLLGWRFLDADDYHTPANISKMSAGRPLTDEDRAPWLNAVRATIESSLRNRENAVLACSALKSAYRDSLFNDPGCVKWVHLTGPAALIKERLDRREGHFAKAALLESQLQALEVPGNALTVDITASPDALAALIKARFLA
jgi:gluconokinase